MKNALLVYSKHVIGFACAIEIPPMRTYKDAVEFLFPTLTSEEFVKELIYEDCLESDLFRDKPYKFVSCEYDYTLDYKFEYEGDVVIQKKMLQFIKVKEIT